MMASRTAMYPDPHGTSGSMHAEQNTTVGTVGFKTLSGRDGGTAALPAIHFDQNRDAGFFSSGNGVSESAGGVVQRITTTLGTEFTNDAAINGAFDFKTAASGIVASTSTLVTQAVSLNQSVTALGRFGKIALFSAVGIGSGAVFLVTNAQVTANSHVYLSVEASTVGNAAVTVTALSVAPGQFGVTVYNHDTVNTTNGTPIISYMIVN